MGDEKSEKARMCSFAPDEGEAEQADEILYRKPGTLSELDESSERCLKHVNERLDQIEEEILTDAARESSD